MSYRRPDLPSPENIYIIVETKCPACDGTGTVMRPVSDSKSTSSTTVTQKAVACDECYGLAGYKKTRLPLIEFAKALKDAMGRLPS